MEATKIILIAFVILFTAVAAICDLKFRKIPNALTVPAFVIAILFAVISGAIDSGLSGAGAQLLFALGGFGTGFGVLFVLWLIGGGGGGDVKYMGALGAWLGAWLTFQVLLVSTIFIVVLSLAALTWNFCHVGVTGVKRKYFSRERTQAKNDRRHTEAERNEKRAVGRRLVPFAVPVGLATWCVLAVAWIAGRNLF